MLLIIHSGYECVAENIKVHTPKKDCFHVVWIMTWKVQVLVAQLCPTLCDPMGYSSPGSSVHEILQARILEWVVISSSRGTTRPRDWTQVSCITGRFFTIWATRGRPSWAQKLLEFLKIVCNLMIKKKKELDLSNHQFEKSGGKKNPTIFYCCISIGC